MKARYIYTNHGKIEVTTGRSEIRHGMVWREVMVTSKDNQFWREGTIIWFPADRIAEH